MAKYKRTIRYQYYQIKAKEINKSKAKDKIFNFAQWIKAIKDNNLMQTAIDFNDAKARIEKCDFNTTSGTWGIRIFKLRNTNIPSKAKDKEDAKVIELEEGEYLGEDIFIVFHPKNGIAMIQQNRLSLGISRIEEFLEETYNRFVVEDEKVVVSIEAILDSNGKSKIRRSDYKYLEIGFANINNFVADDDRKSLGTLMTPLKNIYGVNGNVKISLGRSGLDTLNKKEIRELVREIGMPSNKRYVRTAKLKIKEEDDMDVEIVDLFNDVCNEFIEFSIDSTIGLVFTTTISAMNDKLDKRKNELQNLIEYKERK
ncbi:MAG: hypothetical protein J6B10_01845 [Lachnospiraceae bacterium]|nr:hypothetical protein [Lachnospiraceae bacterium]